MRLSVVTRTCRRPLLLRRAARSVAGARIDDMEWIVVEDDASISAETRQIAVEIERDTDLAVRTLCSHSGGRAAAANAGLRAAVGQWVHFHDDDDTVEPRFYAAATAFLGAETRYKAVRTMCWRVHEELTGDEVRALKKKRVYPERRTVSLLDAAEVFAYPPIGSVFERQTLIDIGGFDQRFDVGEDYELLLRFLLRADIGTIPETLANVHVRRRAAGAYANSPIEGNFAEEDMLFRNALLRADLEAGRLGLGFLLALARAARRNRTLLDYLDAARRRLGW